jgi:type VI secretion system secreted protein Hcp
MALNMHINIAPLKGEARIKKDQIEVLAWSWGASNSGSAHTGGGIGAGKANVHDLSFTKYVDKTSPDLMLSCCNGKHFAEAVLTVDKAGGDKSVEYLKITMKDVMISSLSTGGSGGEDRLTENVTLNFSKVKVKYVEQTKEGSAGSDSEKGWDIAENKQL